MNCADLEALQQSFANALLDVNYAEPALKTFKGCRDLNRQRFSNYRGNLIGTWQNTFANAYPVLKQLVGEEFFNHLVSGYGKSHPSQSGCLTGFGASLPDYIQSLESCRDYPYFVDVAALEWQVHSAYYLEHRTPASLAQLAAFPPEKLTGLRFKLQATCFLFKSAWAIAEIWEAHQHPDVIFPRQLDNETHSLIWRLHGLSNWKIQINSISAASHAALQALAVGKTLGEALEFALAQDPQFAIQTELADWFNKQLFSEIILSS